MKNQFTAPFAVMQSFDPAMMRKNPQPAGTLLLWWPVFWGLGIGLFFLWPQGPLWAGMAGCAATGLVALITWRWRFTRVWLWVIQMMLALAIGLTVMQIRHHGNTIDLLDYPEFNVPITGVIAAAEEAKGGWRIVLDQATVTVAERYRSSTPTHYRLRITVRSKDFVPVIGNRISLRGSLLAPSPPLLPGMFDFRRHAFYNAISGYGFSNGRVEVIDATTPAPWNPLVDYRRYIARRVSAMLRDTDLQPRNSVIGMTTAFLNGQRAGIDSKSQQDMQASGLQHLISISGVHVSMLAAIIFFTVRFLLALSMTLALRWPIKKIAAACAMVGITLYMCVIGISAPTVRSVLTTGMVLLGVMLDREAITLRLVAIAATLILICQPDSLITPGFQMSFAAVVALVVFYQKTVGFWQHEIWRRNVLYRALFVLAGSVATSLVATLATAPFVLYHFQQLPVLSVVSNLLVTPVMSFIVMPGTVLVYLLLPFDHMGHWATAYMGTGIAWTLKIAHWTAMQDAAIWRMNGVMTWQLIAFTFGVLWMLLQTSRMAWWGLVPVVLVLLGGLWGTQPILAVIPTPQRAVIYMPPDENVIYAEGRLDTFTRKLLLQYLKKDKIMAWPRDKAMPADVYLARDIPELKTICDRTETIIVSRWYIDQTCPGKTIIDRHALKHAGQGIVVLQSD